METFNEKVTRLFQKHEALITRTNEPIEEGNGIFTRYKYPVVTAAHTPVFWRYDLNEQTNPLSDGAYRHECRTQLRCHQVEW